MTLGEPPSAERRGVALLSDKEKETLRLIVRGHDAKSTAQQLGLSVHTINERLRDARRKLEVSSSREAARRLFAAETDAPESLGDKTFGDATAVDAGANEPRRSPERWAMRPFALTLAGGIVMSMILAALLLPASPLSLTAGSATDFANADVATEVSAQDAAVPRVAEAWLQLLDAARWAESYNATSREFRANDTLAVWTDVSLKVRPPLGAVVKRDLIANEYVPAPQGYQLVKFRTDYANSPGTIETLTLVREDDQWKVVGIMIG